MTAAPNNTFRTLVLHRIFAAPRALVFAACTRGEHLQQWCAPHGFTIPKSEGDVRPGGQWRSCMVAPDGTECWLSGKYLEVEENRRVVFTHAWEEKGRRGHETTVTLTFADIGPKTKLTLRQQIFDSTASRDGHRDGWSQCLEKLGDLLARLRSKSPKPAAKSRS
ncbi:MAG TPA: SRPBCC domain-containing protein [Candidatus Didemnitutus sp.]|nr:SRPBCC domain-containing protein [Candidatus Didemnitutus sp.]